MIHSDNARIEVVPSPAPAPTDDELSALRARLEAVSLGGLASAADALLGGDAVRVCAMLAAWELHGCGHLPRVTPACWTALGALGLTRPPGPAPQLLDGLLAGVHAEAQAALDALADCHDRAERVSSGLASVGPPGNPNPAIDRWRQGLIAAVADFWARAAELYSALRPSVLRGDHDEVRRLISLASGHLSEAAEHIELLAGRWSGGPPAAAASAGGDGSAVIAPEAPAVGGSALFRPRSTRAPAAPSAPEFHEWAPIAYLAAAMTLAVAVLLFVLLS
ncbi:MAG: hypothetical protein ACREMR_03965 [Gemmatimonadales bacterium]